MGPLEIVEASSSALEFKWRPPKDSGGCKIGNYILERNQVGRNTWKKVGPIGPEAKYRDTDVDHGRRYCYRIRVETEMGTSELMETEDIQAGTKGKLRTILSNYVILEIQRFSKGRSHHPSFQAKLIPIASKDWQLHRSKKIHTIFLH